MSSNDSEKETQPVNLEDLLRLKRAERPDDAFWGRFDRELHQSMLQSLMKKESWHRQFARVLRVRVLQGASLAAVAVFLFAFAIRPAFLNVSGSADSPSGQVAAVAYSGAATPEPMLSRDLLASLPADFGADEIVPEADQVAYTRDFQPEAIEVAAVYDASAYSADRAFSGLGLEGSALAAIVY